MLIVAWYLWENEQKSEQVSGKERAGGKETKEHSGTKWKKERNLWAMWRWAFKLKETKLLKEAIKLPMHLLNLEPQSPSSFKFINFYINNGNIYLHTYLCITTSRRLLIEGIERYAIHPFFLFLNGGKLYTTYLQCQWDIIGWYRALLPVSNYDVILYILLTVWVTIGNI